MTYSSSLAAPTHLHLTVRPQRLIRMPLKCVGDFSQIQGALVGMTRQRPARDQPSNVELYRCLPDKLAAHARYASRGWAKYGCCRMTSALKALSTSAEPQIYQSSRKRLISITICPSRHNAWLRPNSADAWEKSGRPCNFTDQGDLLVPLHQTLTKERRILGVIDVELERVFVMAQMLKEGNKPELQLGQTRVSHLE